MKENIKNLIAVAEREIKRILSRRLYILAVLVFPLVSIAFFGSLFYQGVPVNLPVAVVDLDHTATSRKLIRAIDATQLSEVVMKPNSVNEALSELRKGNIYGIVVLPQNLQADIFNSKQPAISYYYQNGLLIAGGLMQNDLTFILHTLSAGINLQKREATGEPAEMSMAQIQPIQVSTHQLFNPASNYTVYISTIVLPIMLQLFILMITVYSIGIEIKELTSRNWLHTANKSIFIAIAGKLLPYTLLFFVLMMFENMVLYSILGVPFHSNIFWLMVSSLLFVLAYQAIGIFCIGLLPLMRHALNMAAFYGILALTLCGFSFPVESMPGVFQLWAGAFPVRHYMHIFQSQFLAGFEMQYSVSSYVYLLIFLLLPLLVINRLKSALVYQNFIEQPGAKKRNRISKKHCIPEIE